MGRHAPSRRVSETRASHRSDRCRQALLQRPPTNDLTTAIKEYGALRRTIYTARYLADDDYRHRTLRQLNKGENLHDLRRTIAFAGQGALRGHDHADHTEQMWALTLITNAVVVWTTE